MKSTIEKVFAIGMFLLGMLALQNCKKDTQLSKTSDQEFNDSTAFATSALTASYVVSTVAGVPNTPGFADGAAKAALFNGPSGIQLTKDGILYVADRANNAIRKITAGGTVTTLVLKTPQYYDLQSPTSVGVDDAGNIHVLSYLVDQAGLTYIFNNKGSFVAGYEATYTAFGALAKDPYGDFFWFSSSNNIVKHIANASGYIGTDDVPYNKDLLTAEEQARGQSYRGLFVGRNRVIYFAIGPRLFKYTPSGTTSQLYPNLNLGNITSIVLNADSRTIYLAASGKIEKIDNGKLTVLAGPNNTTPDGRDGVASKADVHAYSLALGDHENSIYFSDNSTNTIRKLMFK